MAGRMNEQSAGWSAALTQIPAAVASAATVASTPASPVADTTRRTPSRSAGSYGRWRSSTIGVPVQLRGHVRGDDPHRRPGRGQAGDLAGGDRPGADHEDRDVLEIEEHGVRGTTSS